MKSPINILQQYWHHASFRPMQEEIINAVLEGKDTLALLPTGGGKSICFQVPAMIKDGLCLVISPLIALMKDQVLNLNRRGIPALAIHSGMNVYEVKNTLYNAVHGSYKFLYVSPERLESNLFKEYLGGMNINLVAIDEAHCISQWGYDFRPPYLRIANLREDLPNIPLLALTASATPFVQDDIITKLKFKRHNTFRESFERKNLSYSVFNVDSKINKTVEILQQVAGSSIIYCRSRKVTKEVAKLLSIQNLSADFYHAGLSQDERNNKQEAWMKNKTRVIVCTNAFGMGIDKPDVKTVIHFDAPECIENYYQEAGRAGRNEKKAYAVLLYLSEDIISLESLPGIRFPSMKDIRKTYQALADFLQIPVGLGEGGYYNFELNEFSKNFKLDIQLVVHVLKVLEQEGHITLYENIFIPAQVNFIAPKESLIEIENSHPKLEPLIKCLLRSYEGILENRVSVHEKQIAKLMHLPYEVVYHQLQQLRSLSIIEYLPQKETPQIYFLVNRAPAQTLHINHENYLHRKQQYELRVKEMLRYLHLEKGCRSKYICAYFGDNKPCECGICDTCLQKKNIKITKELFEKIETLIYQHISEEGIAVKELLHHIAGIKKEMFWKVMDFLQAEKKIKVDEMGVAKKIH